MKTAIVPLSAAGNAAAFVGKCTSLFTFIVIVLLVVILCLIFAYTRHCLFAHQSEGHHSSCELSSEGNN
ncbi:hypothetical protein TYRP_014496 [Tyrophagus putrescentiae]|nr:hypothetical protein TYRP_014496 [Tyrophagus putrescentiae]